MTIVKGILSPYIIGGNFNNYLNDQQLRGLGIQLCLYDTPPPPLLKSQSSIYPTIALLTNTVQVGHGQGLDS